MLVDGATDFIYGPNGVPIEEVGGVGGPLYFFRDTLGSTRALLGSDGTVGGAFSYSPYGNVTSATGVATTPVMFAGAYYDQESGFYYLINRYYDPTTDQFVTVDPAVSITQEPYQYGSDNSTNNVDPLGLWGWNPISDVSEAAKDSGNFVVSHASDISLATGVAGTVVLATTSWTGIGAGVGLGLEGVSAVTGGIAASQAFAQGDTVSGLIDVAGAVLQVAGIGQGVNALAEGPSNW